VQTRLTLLPFPRFGRQSSRIFRSNPGRQQSSTAVHLEVSHMLLDWKTVRIFAWGDPSYRRARTQDQRRASQTLERLACASRVFPLASFERTLKLKTYTAVIFCTFSLIHELWSVDFDPFFFQRSLSGGTTPRTFGWVVLLGLWNPYPISDSCIWRPYSRPDARNLYPISDLQSVKFFFD